MKKHIQKSRIIIISTLFFICFIGTTTVLAKSNVATFTIADVEASMGENVLVPVTATIPGQLFAFQFRIEYDPSVLYFVNFQNFHENISGFVGSANHEAGYVTFNYLSFNPVFIPPNAKMFDIQFEYCSDLGDCLSTGGYSGVDFSTTYPNTVSDVDDFFNPINYELDLHNGSVSPIHPIQTLTVNTIGEGTVLINGSPYETPKPFISGTEIDLEAVASSGWEFHMWTGDLSGDNNPTSIIMDSDKEITAQFSSGDLIITVTADPPGGGEVDGGGTYLFNDEATVTAIPNEGYSFVNWTDDGMVVSGSPEYTFTVTVSRNLVANFELITYSVIFQILDEEDNPVNDAVVTLNGLTNEPGEYVFHSLLPDTYIYSVSKTGHEPVSGEVTLVDQDITVDVVLFLQNFNVTFEVDGHNGILEASVGSVPISSGEQVDFGSTVIFEATPDENYQVKEWTLNGDVVKAGGRANNNTSFTYDELDKDIHVTVAFEEINYTLTLLADPEEGGELSGAGNYVFDEEVEVTAAPEEGYHFINWTDEEGAVVAVTPEYAFPMPATDKTLTANFALTEYSVSLTVNPETGGSVTGDGIYTFGENVVLEAIPEEGYRFVNWTDSGGSEVSVATSYSFTMPANDIELTANFEAIDYTVSVTIDPEGAGSVTGEGTFNFGDPVALEATPEEGYSFVNWTDEGGSEVSATVSYSFTMPADNVQLIANFEAIDYTVSVTFSPEGTGTVTGEGTYNLGDNVTMEATPADGFLFVNWTDNVGSELSATASYIFTMPANDVELTANFEPIDYTLTLEVTPGGAGEASAEPVQDFYNVGDEITLSASAEQGYEFQNWRVDDSVVSSNATFIYTMPANNVVVTAHFQEEEVELFDVLLTASPEEGGSVSGEGSFEEEESVMVNAMPNPGYTFVSWTDDDTGDVVSDDASYSFTMPANDIELTANFEAINYTVSVTVSPEGAGTVTGEGTFNVGDNVTLEALPADGYSFLNWTDNGGSEVSVASSYSFTMPANDVELTANFEAIDYTVSVTVSPEGAGTVTGEGTFNVGDNVTLEALPAEGFSFVNWTNNAGSELSAMASYSFTMPADNIQLNANFEAIEYTLTLLVTPAGSGEASADPDQEFYNAGDEITLTASALEGYEFQHWQVDGTVVGSNPTLIYTMPAENAVMTAHFQEEEVIFFDVSLAASPEEGGNVSGEGSFGEGESVTVNATPNPGYTFVNWTDDNTGDVVSEDAAYTFDMPADDVRLTANFLPFSYNITFNLTDICSAPIPNAIVSLNSITNEPGNYLFEDMEPGIYEYTVIAEGFLPESGTVNLVSGHLIINVTLLDVDDDMIKYLQDMTISSSEPVCFDAIKSIVTAGHNNGFIVEDGSMVELIAGCSIIMKAGTTIKAGSQLQAHIDPISPFCGTRDHFLATETLGDDDRSTVDYATHTIDKFAVDKLPDFRVYPNPTRGKFTLEVEGHVRSEFIVVEIFNMQGDRITHKEILPHRTHVFSLESNPPGIYLIRLIDKDAVGIKRILKQQ